MSKKIQRLALSEARARAQYLTEWERTKQLEAENAQLRAAHSTATAAANEANAARLALLEKEKAALAGAQPQAQQVPARAADGTFAPTQPNAPPSPNTQPTVRQQYEELHRLAAANPFDQRVRIRAQQFARAHVHELASSFDRETANFREPRR